MQNLGDCIWRTTRGICTLYQCWHEIFTRERREGSKRQEKRKEKPKKGISDQYLLARERECKTYSERINSMKSDSWSEHSQDLLQLSGSDQTLSDVSSLAHIFFSGDYGANRWRTPHCARRSLQNENPTSPSSDETTSASPPTTLPPCPKFCPPFTRSFFFPPVPSSSYPTPFFYFIY